MELIKEALTFDDVLLEPQYSNVLPSDVSLDQKLSKVFDDHPSKLGRYSPFNNLFVESTDSLNVQDSKYTVILAYIHYKQIIKKHINYLNNGGNFIILWPEVLIINKDNFSKIINNFDE